MILTEVMRQNKEFQLCYHKGRSIGTQYVVIYARKNHLPVNRLGITTGKKVGNAVCRSRARRLIRHYGLQRFVRESFRVVRPVLAYD